MAGSVGFELQLMKDRLLETIANTVPPGFTFRFGTAYFHSSDPTDIRKQILGHSWRVTDPDWVKETVEGKDRDPVYAYENDARPCTRRITMVGKCLVWPLACLHTMHRLSWFEWL
ncbi:hypothetical protein BASA62_003697 [Batrachochytrium salamandrivorans]|nr:hypothetical protein BASA62_003697 [Batrachochytrium salamandrivorans]